MRAALGLAAAGMLAPCVALAAAPPVRVYADFAATDPGTDAFAALLARGAGPRGFGLPAFGEGVVTTEASAWTAWAGGFGRGSSVRARGPGQGGLKSDSQGFVAGADRRVGADAVAGLSAGYASSGWREASGPAKGAADTATLGAYGAAAWPDVAYAAAAVQYAWSDAAVRGPAASGRLSPGTIRAGGLVGRFIDLSGFTFGPVAELEYARTDSASVHESGAGALAVDAPGQTTLTGRAGLRVDSAFYRWGVLGSPHLSLLWERRLVAPDGGGAGRPAALEAGGALVTFGVLARLPGSVILGAEAGGRFGGRIDEQVVRVGLARGF